MNNGHADGAGRLTPQEVGVEKAVLGAMLVDNRAIAPVADILGDESAFYNSAHRKIYAAILELHRKNEPADQVTITNVLEAAGQAEEVGGAPVVAGIAGEVYTAANAEFHARIVLEAAIRRRLIDSCTQTIEEAYRKTEDVHEIIDRAEQRALAVGRGVHTAEPVSWSDAVSAAADRIEWAADHPGEVPGLSTGIPHLDQILGGLEGSTLYVLAARPSEGKTAVGLAIARNVALRGIPVQFVSREMPARALGLRGVSQAARVNMQAARLGRLSERGWDHLVAAIPGEGRLPIRCDDTSVTATEVRASARRAVRKGAKLVVVDYLQIVDPPPGRYGNREQEVAAISRTMKAMAKELDVPVLVLAQISRAVESRENRRPQLQDLRESGSIENDADVVMFLYRPGFQKLKEAKTQEERTAAREDKRMEIIVRKQRQGEVGTVDTYFDPDTQTVGEMAHG